MTVRLSFSRQAMFRDTTIIFRFRGFLGVEVEVGSSLAILALLFLLTSGMSPIGIAFAAAVFGILVLSIYLHELGHAWAMKVQGYGVKRIVLFGGGGFCEPETIPKPRDMEFIALLGPIVNFALWAVLSLVVYYSLRAGGAAALSYSAVLVMLGLAAQINLMLGIFNLLPVQPLDGGRLIHLLLRRRLSADRAIRIAGWVGLVFSGVWFAALIWLYINTGWILLFIPSIPLHWAMAQGRVGG